MPAVTVQGVTLGEGRPAIIVPLTATTRADLLVEAAGLPQDGPDVVEWRADRCEALHRPDELLALGAELSRAIGGRPMLLTVRGTAEGGDGDLDGEAYAALLLAATEAGWPDLVDVELSRPEGVLRRVVDGAHRHGVPVVMSYHDFSATPPVDDLLDLVRRMRALGADVAKVAVMPHSPEDVLTVLTATRRATAEAPGEPVVTVAMGALGVVSRVGGGAFGSAATFASAGTGSAPGQPPVRGLRDALELLHGS